MEKGEIDFMKNSLVLKQLQMAYLAVELEKNADGETCLLCWKKGCKCTESNIKSDPFLNFTGVSEFKYA